MNDMYVVSGGVDALRMENLVKAARQLVADGNAKDIQDVVLICVQYSSIVSEDILDIVLPHTDASTLRNAHVAGAIKAGSWMLIDHLWPSVDMTIAPGSILEAIATSMLPPCDIQAKRPDAFALIEGMCRHAPPQAMEEFLGGHHAVDPTNPWLDVMLGHLPADRQEAVIAIHPIQGRVSDSVRQRLALSEAVRAGVTPRARSM